jgi:hypothetical protein
MVHHVIPAQAGIQCPAADWTPAFAGVTYQVAQRLFLRFHLDAYPVCPVLGAVILSAAKDIVPATTQEILHFAALRSE